MSVCPSTKIIREYRLAKIGPKGQSKASGSKSEGIGGLIWIWIKGQYKPEEKNKTELHALEEKVDEDTYTFNNKWEAI